MPCETAAVSAHVTHTTMHKFTVSLYSEPHSWGAFVFSCNLPSAPLAEGPESFTCYCSSIGLGRRYRNKSQHKKLTLEKRILPPLLPGFEPETFRSRSVALPLSYPRSPLNCVPCFVGSCIVMEYNILAVPAFGSCSMAAITTFVSAVPV